MTDAEYLFKETAAERKRIGYGDRAKKRQGGGRVKLPSDYMTKKEKEAMNGETTTYKIYSPITWPEFKTWPADIQREYFKRLDTSFRPTLQMYAEMLGVNFNTVAKLRTKLNIPIGKRGKSAPDFSRWKSFLMKECPPVTTVAAETPKPATLDLPALLNILAGSGAKVTIEVTL